MRSTRQATAIDAVLNRATGFRSAQDLHVQLRQEGYHVGLTTVYRHLQSLIDAGVVDMVRSIDGEAVYRRCGTDAHHHHLVCRRCGHTVEVEEPVIEAWAEHLARAAGFSDVQHTVEVSGVCGQCASVSP